MLKTISPSKKILQLEDCINNSTDLSIKNLLVLEENNEISLNKELLDTVFQCKNITLSVHTFYDSSFYINLLISFNKILSYNRLMYTIETLRWTAYDRHNALHEKMLKQLWLNLMPHKTFPGYKGCHWSDIGFQGDDPMTDFRGMGILGLMNLLFFTDKYQDFACLIIEYSQHPTHGYPLAIVGINLTAFTYQLLVDGYAKYYFYNAFDHSIPDIYSFQQLYCYIFISFHKLWSTQFPKDIMEFPRIRNELEKMIKYKLEQDDCDFISLELSHHCH